jgi:hypothetical protein
MSLSLKQPPADVVRRLRHPAEAVDLTRVMACICSEHGASDQAAALLERHYRAYLALRARHRDQVLPPSRSIDLVWRTHILQSLSGYMQDSHFVAGRLIDRRSTDAHDPEDFARTKRLLARDLEVDFDALARDPDPAIAGLALPASGA